jgi:hypothetical protein
MSIWNIRYGGTARRRTNGDEEEVSVPPRQVLHLAGPFIQQITITHPHDVAVIFEGEGRQIPAVVVNALIDTGASSTVITPEVADQLSLVHTGFSVVQSVQDEQERPEYFCRLNFPWGIGIEIPVVACPLPGIEYGCLIGREVLADQPHESGHPFALKVDTPGAKRRRPP